MKSVSFKVSPFWVLWLSPPVLVIAFSGLVLSKRALEVLEP